MLINPKKGWTYSKYQKIKLFACSSNIFKYLLWKKLFSLYEFILIYFLLCVATDFEINFIIFNFPWIINLKIKVFIFLITLLWVWSKKLQQWNFIGFLSLININIKHDNKIICFFFLKRKIQTRYVLDITIRTCQIGLCK